MRAFSALILGVLVLGCGAEPSEESAPLAVETSESESGLTLSRVSESEVTGSFNDEAGSVAFSSSVVGDGLIDVKFDRGGRVFSSHVDWTSMQNDLAISDGGEVTADDRAVLQALSVALEQELGKSSQASDNLVRQAILWGHHPEGRLAIAHITADQARGWTTLCNGTSYRNFYHDTGSHGLQGEYLKYGPNESANPCRARCGVSCYAIGTSAWTVDCGNHDRCEQLHGSGCGDEFTSASDDFTFAGNCKY